MIAKILAAIGIGTPKPRGTAHVGSKGTRLYSIYQDNQVWYFSWHREDHSAGAVVGPFEAEWQAEDAFDDWAYTTRNLILVRV